jgi:multidrug resistance efflux pump
MKSFLGMLFTMIVLLVVLGGGALLWYISYSTEVTRKPTVSAESIQ